MKENWSLKQISAVAQIINGGTPKSKIKEYWNGDIAWITPADLGKLDNVYVTDTSRKITEEGLNRSSAKLFRENSVILSTRAPIGHLAINQIPMSTNQGCRGLVPNEELHEKYLFYFLLSSVNLLNDLGTGTTFKELSTRALGSVKIPIPPLSEQKQIVAILDKAFAAIDQAKANIERNIDNAKELFQSKLNEIFSQQGEGWEEKSIEEVSNVVNGYSFKSKDFSPTNEIKAIKITNVGIKEFVEDDSNNLPNSYLKEYSKVLVRQGDLVLALTRTIISGGLKVARVPASYHNSLLNQRVAAIVPNTALVDSDYLYYYFSSNIVYNYVLDNVNTLMQPNLSITDLKKMPVPTTSISKQKEISQQIEGLSERSNSLIEAYAKKLESMEELKKSLLQKAFAGELTSASSVTSENMFNLKDEPLGMVAEARGEYKKQ